MTLLSSCDSSIFLLREPFPLSCALEILHGSILAGL